MPYHGRPKEHPLVPVIRFWLLCVLALATLLIAPSIGIYLLASFAWTPLGLFMPVLGSSPTIGTNCTNCTSNTVSTQYQLVFSCPSVTVVVTQDTSNNPSTACQPIDAHCSFGHPSFGSACGFTADACLIFFGTGFTAAKITEDSTGGAVALLENTSGRPSNCLLSAYSVGDDVQIFDAGCGCSSSDRCVVTAV